MSYNLQHLLNLVHEPNPTFDAGRVEAFIEAWKDSGGAESSHAQPFFVGLFALMGLEAPYEFEAAVRIPGDSNPKKMDVYRARHWVIEAKQGSFAHHATPGHGLRGTSRYQKAMEDAFHQVHRYAVNAAEGVPPVIMVVDIGYRFDIWTAFGGGFGGYGARGTFQLEDLRNPEVYSLLYDLLDDPQRRNPERVAAHVTRDVATRLARLAKNLEESGHDPEKIAKFLMRCLFTMFAEDIRLLDNRLFEKYLVERWIPDPRLFKPELEMLWKTMDQGGNLPFVGAIYRFNGALFRDAEALELTRAQIEELYDAARADWSNVEPSIFGTLLERALNARERHSLGAHYTPRAYIERLVRPTIEEPLREKWQLVEAQVKLDTAVATDKDSNAEPTPAQRKKAIDKILAFKKELSSVRVLDPACGSGNFLYVTFDLLKNLEVEIDARLEELGHTQQVLGMGDLSVTPAQFFGIEIKPWAKEIAELVIWIGFLQWWRRRHPNSMPVEPILRDHHNIECRDAVLAYDAKMPRVDPANGEAVTVWDGFTMKVHPVTGEQVPDESARRVVYDYVNPRKAEWPEADYVVGNPPFIGPGRLRDALGSGYIEALWKAHSDVPQSADFVMFWWNHAGELLSQGKIQRFGFITTNSLTQKFSRRVVQRFLEHKSPISLVFAIPDHPWVDSEDGAAVRISMTAAAKGEHHGTLAIVTKETPGKDAIDVEILEAHGLLNSDLTIGVDVTQAIALESNSDLGNRGVSLFGMGFTVTPEQAKQLGLGVEPGLEKHIRHYRNGRDLLQAPRNVMVIDLFGLELDEVRERYPAVYQWVYDRVKPERDNNNRASRRNNWWLFGETNPKLRNQLKDLPRYITTVETSKHRIFIFLENEILPDNRLVNIALSDAFHLGVLSSRIHVAWALATGGRLEDRPVYNKTVCFDPFPFPDASEERQQKIRNIAEELDAHRKRQQERHPKLTMTNMYNVLEKLRAGEELTAKEKVTHEEGLVSILKQLHDELDAAVFAAYGWPETLDDEEILQRLVDLNRERAEEEARGLVRWLRPEFQNPGGAGTQETQEELVVEGGPVVDVQAIAAGGYTWAGDALERLEVLRNVVKTSPGLVLEAIQAHFVKGGAVAKRNAAIAEALAAMQSAGVVVQTPDGRWF